MLWLGLVAVALPLWTWDTAALDASRADGALFSALVALTATVALLRRPRLSLPLLPGSYLLSAALLLSLLPLFVASLGLAGWAPLVGGLADRAPLLSAWLLVAVLAAALPRDEDGRWLLPLLGAGAAAATFALIQALGFNPPGFLAFGRLRPAYPFQGLSQAGEFLAPALLLAAAVLPTWRPQSRWWWLLCAPMALELGFLASNAIRLSLLLALAWGWWRHATRRRSWLVLAALVLVGELLHPLLAAGGGDRLGADLPQGMAVRLEIDRAGLSQSLHRPFGLGLGQFESDYPRWRPEAEAMAGREALREAGRLRQPKTPHNEVLLALLESGWLGLILLAAAALRLWRCRRQLHPGPQLTDPAWIALAVHALVRSPFSDNPPALGLAALMLAHDLRGLPRPQGSGLQVRLGSALPLLLGAAALLPAWPQWQGERWSSRAVSGDSFDADSMIRATEARPWDARAWVLLASYYLAASHQEGIDLEARTRRADEARLCLRQAMLVAPYDLSALTAAIKVELEAPNGDEALMRGLIARAESFAPYEPAVKDARLLLLKHYRDQYRQTAVAMVRQGQAGAQDFWAAMYLAEARIAAVEGRTEDIRRDLMQAASYLPGQKSLLERTAMRETFDQRLLEELCHRVFPAWPQLSH